MSIVAVAIRDYTNTQKSLLMKYKNNRSDPAYKKAMTEATLLLGISFAFAAATGIASYLGIQANRIPLSLMKSIALGVSSGIELGGAVPSVFLDFSLLYRSSRR